MAAIATLDAAVVEAGGEVITLADREAAITELDAAVEEGQHVRLRLLAAIGRAQDVQAWLADNAFQASVAAGTVEIEQRPDGKSGGQFVAWCKHRYTTWVAQFGVSQVGRFGQAGRALNAIGMASPPNGRALPSGERQLRPLTRLLGRHEDSIPKVWEQAITEAEADHKPQSVARYVDRIIRSEWPELFEKPAPTQDQLHDETDRKLRQFRNAYDWLRDRMDCDDFEERVLAWLAHNPY